MKEKAGSRINASKPETTIVAVLKLFQVVKHWWVMDSIRIADVKLNAVITGNTGNK
jgi:hypothetical protein